MYTDKQPLLLLLPGVYTGNIAEVPNLFRQKILHACITAECTFDVVPLEDHTPGYVNLTDAEVCTNYAFQIHEQELLVAAAAVVKL